MQFTQNLKDDPHDVLVLTPDVVLAARQDVSRADKISEIESVLASAGRAPDARARAAADFSAGPSVPPVDTTFRATDVRGARRGSRSGFRTWAARAAVGFMFALVSAIGAAAWHTHGGAARQMIATWIPPLALIAPSESQAAPEPDQPAAQAAAATSDAPSQPAAATDASADATPAAAPGPSTSSTSTSSASTSNAPASSASASTATPAAAAPAADQGSQLQSMSRDLAAATQQIEQLKASIAELKATQEKMSREIARADAKADVNARPKAAPRPVAAVAPPVHRPMPQTYTYRPAQAAAAPMPPPQTIAPAPYVPPPPPQAPLDPELASVPRPPMPVR
ncbi:hypothetical protein [Bradyrhizobium sp. NP1]|uniref:hypothetical protein n=1 Tax=Bradyrhizobium sp. NP1 TaxID=3049772 RepID=UPI0025A5664D|nr:hypothetical protein [Bradyrhizobium sp. NP1]WJR81081.1 hypothetical protein QOU61_15400 [Bradyrhizobium sp. NP1]